MPHHVGLAQLADGHALHPLQDLHGLLQAAGLVPGQHPGPGDADRGTGLIPLGDMVLSMERVSAQAKEFGHSKRRELAYLVTHSVLHLLGYDHLDEGPMKAQMRGREEAIMALLGLER